MKKVLFILSILISFSSFADLYTENHLTLEDSIQQLFHEGVVNQTKEFETLMFDEEHIARSIYEKGIRRSDLDYCRKALIPGLESCWTVSIGKNEEFCSKFSHTIPTIAEIVGPGSNYLCRKY